MKTKLFSAIGILSLVLACNKVEIENTISVTDGVSEITAQINNSKTSYDDQGKFSWEANDRITVVLYNDGTSDSSKQNVLDHYTFNNSSGAGVTATFTGSPINAPWHETGIALYPNVNASTKNCLKEAGNWSTGVQVTMQQEIVPNLSNPLAVVPLIGRKNTQGVYQFNTATGILAVTLENIPSDAYYLYLQDPSESYAFSGTYAIGDLSEIRAQDAVSPSGNSFKKTIAFTPQNAHETRTFYFPVPTGTIPAGTQLKLDKGSDYANIMTKTFNSPVTITANHVTPLKSLYVNPEVSELFGRYRINNDSAYITLAASDVDGKNIKITRYENSGSNLDISGTCQGVYDRTNGTITFASMQLFADTGDDWTNGADVYYSFRSYDSTNQDLVLYVNSSSELSTNGKRFDFSKFVSSYTAVNGYLEFKRHGNSLLTKVE